MGRDVPSVVSCDEASGGITSSGEGVGWTYFNLLAEAEGEDGNCEPIVAAVDDFLESLEENRSPLSFSGLESLFAVK